MVRIHGLVYVLIGIFMSGYSRFIQSKADAPVLKVFFWLGIVFIVVGVFRLVLRYLFKDKKDSDSLKNKLNDVKKDNFSDNNSNSKEIVSCSRCMTKHYSNSNFCHMCGFSLK